MIMRPIARALLALAFFLSLSLIATYRVAARAGDHEPAGKRDRNLGQSGDHGQSGDAQGRGGPSQDDGEQGDDGSGGASSSGQCGSDAGDASQLATVRAEIDAACDCTGATNHGQYVSCVARVAGAARQDGRLRAECLGELDRMISCAGKSTCGKERAVVCCRTFRSGRTSCSVRMNPASCRAPTGGSACVSDRSSCCEACGPEGCPPVATTTTTVLTSTTTTLPPHTTSTTVTTTTTITTPLGAIQCCVQSSPIGAFNSCILVTATECSGQNGIDVGPGSCSPNPCPPSTTTTAPPTTTTMAPPLTPATSARATTTSTTTRTTTARPTTTSPAPSATAHYEYVFPDGAFYVYDMDNGHQLVKQVALPEARGIRGVVAHAATHSLYVSYGGDGNGQNGTPTLLKYDLLSDAVVWTHSYAIGIDSMSITPDGSTLYMPSGELASGGTWYVLSAATGDVVGTIDGPAGPHNTIVSLDGAHVYLGGRAANALGIVDTATNQVVRRIGPLEGSVRPFTINGRETIAYITLTGRRGFQIGAIATGQVLGTVTFTGPNVSPAQPNDPSAPSHGISLSPDERELYVVDWPDYVHVFDVSGVPAQAPRQVADIALTPSMNHVESPCLYDCLADGWLQHSRDGRFVYVGDQGDVIDTATRRAVTNLSTLSNTRKMIEIDWSQGLPVFAATARASVGYVR
jgi:hypothetical protein